MLIDIRQDRPFDEVGGVHAPPVMLWQGEDSQAFVGVVIEPVGEAVEFLLRRLQRRDVPGPP